MQILVEKNLLLFLKYYLNIQWIARNEHKFALLRKHLPILTSSNDLFKILFSKSLSNKLDRFIISFKLQNIASFCVGSIFKK